MKSLLTTLGEMLQGITRAVARFPLTAACLLGSTALSWYLIWLDSTPALITQKLLFVFLLGSFIGVTAQFACERLPRLADRRLSVYGGALLLTGLYYLSIAGATAIDYGVAARTMVAVFAMFCAFIWLPSYRDAADFNTVALIHFKSALTSFLYAGVLSLGLAALFLAIDILLFNVPNNTYAYMLSGIWLLFATLTYLGRLPHWHRVDKVARTQLAEAGQYPRVLELLVLQIAIPLLAAYTLVLLAYFVKIGVSGAWPVGQLGPMILAYSVVGLLLFILASRSQGRSAQLYRLIFPKILLPIVAMQLISVSIRLRAYGVTESRYYVTLFGVFSLVVGLVLTLRPRTKNGIIAILAALFAILSVVPPLDAFTVSRQSQINRLETMLQSAGILVEGRLEPQPQTERRVQVETTSILNYLQGRGYLAQIPWLPQDFTPYRDMEKTLGFAPLYHHQQPDEREYFYANLDSDAVLDVSGYDTLLQVSSYRYRQEDDGHSFTVGNNEYRLLLQRRDPLEVEVAVQTAAGEELVRTGLAEFMLALRQQELPHRDTLSLEQMTLDVAGSGCQLRIIFRNISATFVADDQGSDYSMIVLVAISPRT